MRCLIAIFCVMFTVALLGAEIPGWKPAPGHTQVPIWPENVPDAQPLTGPENETKAVTTSLVAGKPWVAVANVSRPTMTVYSPKGTNTGVAVVVFPGGGYHVLAIDLEGTEVCEWLASQGITGVLLKYRVPFSGPHWDRQLNRHVTPKTPMAL